MHHRSYLAAGLLPIVLLVLGATADARAGTTADVDDSEIKHIVYPDWFSESLFFDLPEELDKAGSAGKLGLMVLFTTEGCSYCHLFVRKSLGDPDLAALVRQHFESVGMEIFDDREMVDPAGTAMPIKEFADHEGAEFAPTLLFYGADGRRILKVVGYQSPARFRLILEFLIDEHFRSQSLAGFLRDRAHVKEVLASRRSLLEDEIFIRPPYSLVRNDSQAHRPLVVIFEQAGCTECEEFHAAVLSEGDVRETLSSFDVVRLDAADNETGLVTPDGRARTPATWYGETGFSRTPALMFFDENGQLVLETDALVLRQRMMNSLNFVLERAYEKGWTYQRFARSKAIERWQARQDNTATGASQ